MGHTHRHQFGFKKKNQVKSPSIWSRVPETGSDPPIGSGRDSGCDKLHDIQLENTIPKTPQQNGVAKRMNRTIEKRIRCILSHSKLPKSFWGEATRTTINLINLSPSVPLKSDVPERVWTGKDVSYDHLRVFGCREFVHIPKDERSKLDVKATPCIF